MHNGQLKPNLILFALTVAHCSFSLLFSISYCLWSQQLCEFFIFSLFFKVNLHIHMIVFISFLTNFTFTLCPNVSHNDVEKIGCLTKPESDYMLSGCWWVYFTVLLYSKVFAATAVGSVQRTPVCSNISRTSRSCPRYLLQHSGNQVS